MGHGVHIVFESYKPEARRLKNKMSRETGKWVKGCGTTHVCTGDCIRMIKTPTRQACQANRGGFEGARIPSPGLQKGETRVCLPPGFVSYVSLLHQAKGIPSIVFPGCFRPLCSHTAILTPIYIESPNCGIPVQIREGEKHGLMGM